jgi:hypothetical protein
MLTLLCPKVGSRPSHDATQSFDLFFMTLGNIAVVGFAQSLNMQMVVRIEYKSMCEQALQIC